MIEQKCYDYLPCKFTYYKGDETPEGSTLSTCAYCGRVVYIPKECVVMVTYCCDDKTCITRFKNRNIVTRKNKRKFNAIKRRMNGGE